MSNLTNLMAHLITSTGNIVADVEIPPFLTGYPPALRWGVRTFVRVGDPHDHDGTYAEVFCYDVPDTARVRT